MIISHKYKFICLNPPKTGSGTREIVFKDLSDIDIHKYKNSNKLWTITPKIRHLNYDEMQHFCSLYDIQIQKYFIVTFLRNPWRRIESWYGMKVNQDERWRINHEDFNKFIHSHINKKRWQDEYFFNKNIDYIGSLETINTDIKHLCSVLNIKKEIYIPHHGKQINKQIKNEIKELWTTNLIEFVGEKEKHTIKLKNYFF